jgi:hypothetical protein
VSKVGYRVCRVRIQWQLICTYTRTDGRHICTPNYGPLPFPCPPHLARFLLQSFEFRILLAMAINRAHLPLPAMLPIPHTSRGLGPSPGRNMVSGVHLGGMLAVDCANNTLHHSHKSRHPEPVSLGSDVSLGDYSGGFAGSDFLANSPSPESR